MTRVPSDFCAPACRTNRLKSSFVVSVMWLLNATVWMNWDHVCVWFVTEVFLVWRVWMVVYAEDSWCCAVWLLIELLFPKRLQCFYTMCDIRNTYSPFTSRPKPKYYCAYCNFLLQGPAGYLELTLTHSPLGLQGYIHTLSENISVYKVLTLNY